ncbi:hypothetical protein ACFY1U_45220 [Streptomyces sp. NPDC001351]|uniref:hypothetical protein n=1 Tax=Streptomyces sp. NPDC001351 TaxID=3364564 RepID=UPI003674300E
MARRLAGAEYCSDVSIPPAPQSPYQMPLAPWGTAPPAPPEKSRVGLIAAIIGGVFLLIIVVLLVALVVIGKRVENSYPRAEFSLTVPRTLLDGRFKLTKDDSPTMGGTLQRSWRHSWDAEAVHGVAAVYQPNSIERGDLVVTGMYGRFKNTDEVRSRVLADNGSKNSRVKVLTPPEDDTPSGSRIKISCEAVTRTWADGATLSYPVCAWADGNTWARVADMTLLASTNLDLKATARSTLQIRSEMVKPIT